MNQHPPTDHHDAAADHSSTHSSLPDSAQYIDESTLIPASSFQMEGESPEVIGETNFAAETPAQPFASGKQGFDLKKNMPIVAAGVVGAILIGGLGIKMMGASAPASPTPAVQMVKPASMPVSISAGPTASGPAVAVAPEPVVASAPSAAPNAAPAPTNAAPASPAAVAPDGLKDLEARTTTHGSEISSLKERVTKLEDARGAAPAASPSAAPAAGAKAAAPASKAASKPTAAQLKARAEAREAAQQRAAQKAAAKAAHEAREAKIDARASSLTITAIKDNLVWVRDGAAGDIRAYAMGETIPGVGKLTNVDEKSWTATAAGRVIR